MAAHFVSHTAIRLPRNEPCIVYNIPESGEVQYQLDFLPDYVKALYCFPPSGLGLEV
jgi:hypothetical protein